MEAQGDLSENRGRQLNNTDWSRVLIEALPYFKLWCGKTIVIKYGGNAMLNEELKAAVVEDIVLLSTIGVHVVLVHGGGPEINKMLDNLHLESHFENGLRVTDDATMDVVLMVLAGKLNKDIVALLLNAGGRAVGVSGIDSGLLVAKALDAKKLGHVGEVTQVNPKILSDLLQSGYIPVVSTVGVGSAVQLESDSDLVDKMTFDPHTAAEDGQTAFYNINADTAAAKIAVALKAEKFVQLTNVPGVMRNMDDTSSLIPRISASNVPLMVDQGIISGGMIPKVECCLTAISGGVRRTHIIDGRVPHSLLIEMFSDRGIGTMIY